MLKNVKQVLEAFRDFGTIAIIVIVGIAVMLIITLGPIAVICYTIIKVSSN